MNNSAAVSLEAVDWILIVAYFVFTIVIALLYSRRAGKSTSEFFLGGRGMPWYLAGLSMVATTFAADTPLAVSEIIYKNGISGNWLWWNFLVGGMLTTFFFAKLWRRAGILTEVEFIELRYDGAPSRFLRGFKSVYLGLFMNVIILGWVNKALVTLLEVFFSIPQERTLPWVAGAMLITALYSALSGLMGVAVTDAFQFVIAMTGCIVLAILVITSPEVGGMDGLMQKLGPDNPAFHFFPTIGTESKAGSLSISGWELVAYLGFMWWASWYPGAEPGGGGYVAQRMMSAKNEKHSLLATLFFQVAHYCIRPWPWILVGLASLVLYPSLGPGEERLGYVYAMRDFLPAGLRGLLIVAFLGAYMSTIATQLNWGASYLVNDLWKPFIRKPSEFQTEQQSEKHYVGVSRVVTLLLMVLSLAATLVIDSISGVWSFIMECGAGLGLVLILRWYWWRINAWAEIAATIAPFFWFSLLKYALPYAVGTGRFAPDWLVWLSHFPGSYLATILLTTITWLAVMYLTPPEPEHKLKTFWERVHPGWGPWRTGQDKPNFIALFISWFTSVGVIYSSLFLTGKLILGDMAGALTFVVSGGICLTVLLVFLRKGKVLE